MIRTYRFLSLSLILLLASAATVLAQENPNTTWKLLTPTVTGAPGKTVDVKVQVKIKEKSHLYSTKTYPDDAFGPNSTVVTVGDKPLSYGGKLKGPKPHSYPDPNFDNLETEYWEGTVTLTVPVKIAKDAKEGTVQGWVNFFFQTCDDHACQLPMDKKLEFTVDIKADTVGAAAVMADSIAQAADSSAQMPLVDTALVADTMMSNKAPDTAAAVTSSTKDELDGPVGGVDEIRKAKEEGLGAYLGLAALAGLLALMTPCVFPMIPITVSFFTKRPHTTRSRAVRDASIYSLGIILTFTAIGFLFAVLVGAAGLNDFAANPFVNIAIAGIFIMLSLNLLGMFEIQIPTSILNSINSKTQEGDGITSVLLMGLLFSLTSFTCTVPFVGGVITAATGGEWLWPLMGMAVFATVFSAPFFVLALFPALLKSLPKSGGWLNSIKVVMGFVEIAAAIKFLSNADLVWQWGIFTRELFLSIWVALAVIITVYLLGRFQLPHDTPVEKVGPLRAVFAVSALAIGFWLLTGLFGGRLGELDAFIAPQDYPGKGNTSLFAGLAASGGGKGGESHGLAWMEDDYQKALATARETGKPMFIDFTGYTCTNCRWMEQNMFTRDEISELMK
jgi:thiol:disulfide interchange protein DsbD